MLTSLDPHSSYLSPDDAEQMRVQTRGEFGGLGIEVTQEEGFVKVVSPIDDTPADAAGIEAGDFITHVDGESILGLTLDKAVDLMRGPGRVRDRDHGRARRRARALRRHHHPRHDQADRRARPDRRHQRGAARHHLQRPDLSRTCKEGLEEQIEEAGGIENVNGIVLDLRNNPGGLLTQAIKVSDAFLDEGEIVSTRGRNPKTVSGSMRRPAIWPKASRSLC